jgi:hypothetical protein
MVKSFALIDQQAKVDLIDKRSEFLTAVKELEASRSMGLFTNLTNYYDFMLETDENGKLTGHYVTNFRSKAFEDYREIIRITNEFSSDLDKVLIYAIKKAWKDGTASLTDKQTIVLNKVLKDNKALIESGKESVFKPKDGSDPLKIINQFVSDGNAPLDKAGFERGQIDYIKSLYADNTITKKEFGVITKNLNAPWEEKYDYVDMVSLNMIESDTADLLLNWIYDNSWNYRVPQGIYANPQWDTLSKILEDENDSRGKFYNFIVDVSKEAERKVPYKFKLGTRLPGIVKSDSERVKEGDSIVTIFNRNLLHSTTLRKEDTERGIDESLDETGKAKYFVPIYYTAKIDPVDQSYDLPTIYLKYWNTANEFELKNEIAPKMEMAKHFVDTRKTLVGVNKYNEEIVRDNSNLASQLNDWMLSLLYGKKEVEGANIKIFGKVVNVDKILKLLNKYTAFNLLGANYLQGAANLLLGENMQAAEAIAQEYITPSAYTKGSGFYAKHLPGMMGDIGAREPSNLASMIIEQWDVLHDYSIPEFRRNSKYRDLMQSNTLFFTSKVGEHIMQSRFLFGFLANTPVYNKKGEKIGVALDYYTKNKIGKLVFDENNEIDREASGVTDKDIEIMKIKVRGILSRLHGEYSELGRVAVQRYGVGQMALMFRKFIVPGFKRRFEKYDYVERLNQFTEGNYRTTASFLGRFFKDLWQFKFTLIQEDWNSLSDHEKANIKRTLYEATMVLVSWVIAGMCVQAMKDSDDDDEEKFYAMLAYQLYRLRSELSFFIFPPSALAILRSPMASMSVLENLIQVIAQSVSPLEIYERGPFKGQYKLYKESMDLVPVFRQIYRYDTLTSSINWFK